MVSGGMKLVNQVLGSNAGTSVSVSSSLLLDGSGSDTNRGNIHDIASVYYVSQFVTLQYCYVIYSPQMEFLAFILLHFSQVIGILNTISKCSNKAK